MKNKLHLIIGVLALGLLTVQAQEIVLTNVITSTNVVHYVDAATYNKLVDQLNSPQVSDLAGKLYSAVTTSTNLAIAAFYGKKTTGRDNVAGALVSYDLLSNMALVVGGEHLWGETNEASFTVSGGLQLHADRSFSPFGHTNLLTVGIFGMTLIGTPLNGDNNGNLMNVNRVGGDIRLAQFGGGWELLLGAAYGNRTGTGNYNGNWVDVFLCAAHKFKYLDVDLVAKVGN